MKRLTFVGHDREVPKVVRRRREVSMIEIDNNHGGKTFLRVTKSNSYFKL